MFDKTKLLRPALLILFLLTFLVNRDHLIPNTQAQAKCSIPIPSTRNTVTTEITVAKKASYVLWSRVLASSTDQSSYLIQIDSGCIEKIGGNLPASRINRWSWINYKNGSASQQATFQLNAGKHKVRIFGDSEGLGLDKILLLNNTCTPKHTSDGSDCLKNTSPTPRPATQGPKNLVAVSDSDSTVNLKWDAVSGATKYNVYIMEEDDNEYRKKTTVSKPTTKFTDLNSDEVSRFYVTAVIKENESLPSEIASALIK